MVKESNCGATSPCVLCSACKQKLDILENKKRKQLEEHFAGERLSLKKRRRKSIFWGIFVGLIILAFTILGSKYLGEEYSKEYQIVWTVCGVFFSYGAFCAVSQMCLDEGPATDIMLWFVTAPIKFPGIIFSWSIDGCLFAIVLKILFAVLGFLIGVVLFVLGAIVSSVVGAFTYPFTIHKFNKRIKGL